MCRYESPQQTIAASRCRRYHPRVRATNRHTHTHSHALSSWTLQRIASNVTAVAWRSSVRRGPRAVCTRNSWTVVRDPLARVNLPLQVCSHEPLPQDKLLPPPTPIHPPRGVWRACTSPLIGQTQPRAVRLAPFPAHNVLLAALHLVDVQDCRHAVSVWASRGTPHGKPPRENN